MCPIFEYQCKVCKDSKEELQPVDQDISPSPCMKCLAPMYKIISASRIAPQVKGSNNPVKQ